MKKIGNICFALACVATMACESTFLEVKPDSGLVVPTKLSDFDQLLNHESIYYSGELPIVLADEYYLTDQYWQSIRNPLIRNAYIWSDSPYENTLNLDDWSQPYRTIFYSNVVLDGLEGVPVTAQNKPLWNRLRGEALFLRSHALHNLVQLFAPAYHPATAGADTGVILPLSSDVNEPASFSTVEETYRRIVSDLEVAVELLGDNRDYTRPTRPAALALMARVYLSMGEYGLAGDYAGRCLSLYADLVDFNTISVVSRDVYDEVLYASFINSAQLIFPYLNQNVIISPELYGAYKDGDLRKDIYFRVGRNGLPYRAQSQSFYYPFMGLATDEVVLISAESNARMGRLEAAAADINRLLEKRYRRDAFDSHRIIPAEVTLEAVLEERRKELVFRGQRWADLKRFNVEGRAIRLERNLGENTFSLDPNSERWVFPVPPNENNSIKK